MVIIQRPRDGALLVSESAQAPDAVFHRPLGGHVELGEYAADTAQRELREEIGQDLAELRLAGVLENIFDWHGRTAHEIVFVFTAALADENAYEISDQVILDSDGPSRVIWRPLAATEPPLYPDGVATLALHAGIASSTA